MDVVGRRMLGTMVSVAAALATTALALAPPAAPAAELSRGALRRTAELRLQLVPDSLESAGFPTRSRGPRDGTPPPCLGDVCQPIVSVPGFEPRYGRAHRSELFVLALQRAQVEPLATVAWALVATGLRFDWSPPVFDGANVNAHGWGSVMLRLRVRIDATNHLVFPKRPSAS